VQLINVFGLDIADATAQEQGCDPSSDFAFLDLQNHTSYANHYYRQKLEVVCVVILYMSLLSIHNETDVLACSF
jgi:hypothetical protein